MTRGVSMASMGLSAASTDHDADHLVVDGMVGQRRHQLCGYPPGPGASSGVSTGPPADQASTPLSSPEQSCERIFTIGHSTHPIDEFVRTLTAHGVEQVVDVRTIAKSRHNPQFGEDEFRKRLSASGIGYGRIEALGGLRHTGKDSQNGAWKNASFRGYADYMQTPAFAAGLDRLIEWGARTRVAMMCAEAVPWRCHRSLIGDALLVRGIDVQRHHEPNLDQGAHVDPVRAGGGEQDHLPLPSLRPGRGVVQGAGNGPLRIRSWGVRSRR
jgi:hypothetical protein